MSDNNNNENHDLEDDETLPEYYVVTDELDLHGFFPEQVPVMVEEFIRNALELKLDRVRIIHGKGKSRLKHTVYTVLRQHPAVLKFENATPTLGGWGATVVHFKIA